jgi:hypothetical protein
MVPFQFADVAEVRIVAKLSRRQAQALQMLAARLTGHDSDDYSERAREAAEIASRIDMAADPAMA